jgi:glycerophosphoryl diester phosphodiesterase
MVNVAGVLDAQSAIKDLRDYHQVNPDTQVYVAVSFQMAMEKWSKWSDVGIVVMDMELNVWDDRSVKPKEFIEHVRSGGYKPVVCYTAQYARALKRADSWGLDAIIRRGGAQFNEKREMYRVIETLQQNPEAFRHNRSLYEDRFLPGVQINPTHD